MCNCGGGGGSRRAPQRTPLKSKQFQLPKSVTQPQPKSAPQPQPKSTPQPQPKSAPQAKVVQQPKVTNLSRTRSILPTVTTYTRPLRRKP